MLRRPMILIACLLSVPAAAAELPCDPTFDRQLEEVRLNLRGRHLDVARALLDRAGKRLAEPLCPASRNRFTLLESVLLVERGELTAADEKLQEVMLPEDLPDLLTYHHVAGTLPFQLGQFSLAQQHFEKLLQIDRAAGDLSGAAGDLYMIAACRLLSSDPEDRESIITHFREALAAADAAEAAGHEPIPEIYLTLARLLDGAESEAFFARSLKASKSANDRAGTLSALALRKLETDPDEAVELLDEALEIAELALREDANPWPMLMLANDRLAIRWATAPRERALAEAESSLSFLESIRLQQAAGAGRSGFFSIWNETYHRMVGRILESAGAGTPPERDLALAFGFMERYRARALADSFSVEEADQAFATLDQVRLNLAPDEALLSFQVAPDEDLFKRFGGGSWLLAVSRRGASVYRLPTQSRLDDRVKTYLGSVAGRHDSEGTAAAGLYADLLAAALADLPAAVDKLLLVPDAQLHLVPFGALRATPEALPLALEYQLATIPSASLWLRWRTADRRPVRASALVLANPSSQKGKARRRLELGELPYAGLEGRAVIEQVGGDSLLRLDGDASEAFFRSQDLRRYGILHFAAHAVVDDIHPSRSAVHLAAGADEDGELRAEEIAGLELSGQLVLLSACQTASGRILRGEGVMSLARSFFQAGAGTVVGSLWPLDDREAHLLFSSFYRYLARGHSVRGALQLTQRELRARGAPPAAWAGVVVLGDGERVPLPRPPLAILVPIVVPALSLLVILFFLWWGRRSHPDPRPGREAGVKR